MKLFPEFSQHIIVPIFLTKLYEFAFWKSLRMGKIKKSESHKHLCGYSCWSKLSASQYIFFYQMYLTTNCEYFEKNLIRFGEVIMTAIYLSYLPHQQTIQKIIYTHTNLVEAKEEWSKHRTLLYLWLKIAFIPIR